ASRYPATPPDPALASPLSFASCCRIAAVLLAVRLRDSCPPLHSLQPASPDANATPRRGWTRARRPCTDFVAAPAIPFRPPTRSATPAPPLASTAPSSSPLPQVAAAPLPSIRRTAPAAHFPTRPTPP